MAQIGRQRTKRTVYEESSRRMLTDARFLFKHGRWHGSVYLAGYAVECKLKAAVCQHLGVEGLPERFWTHDLQFLIRSTGLAKAVNDDETIRACFRRIDSIWRVEIRYTGKPYGKQEADGFLNDVRRVIQWLNAMLLRRR